MKTRTAKWRWTNPLMYFQQSSSPKGVVEKCDKQEFLENYVSENPELYHSSSEIISSNESSRVNTPQPSFPERFYYESNSDQSQRQRTREVSEKHPMGCSQQSIQRRKVLISSHLSLSQDAIMDKLQTSDRVRLDSDQVSDKSFYEKAQERTTISTVKEEQIKSYGLNIQNGRKSRENPTETKGDMYLEKSIDSELFQSSRATLAIKIDKSRQRRDLDNEYNDANNSEVVAANTEHYDRSTWKMYHRITRARIASQQRNNRHLSTRSDFKENLNRPNEMDSSLDITSTSIKSISDSLSDSSHWGVFPIDS